MKETNEAPGGCSPRMIASWCILAGMSKEDTVQILPAILELPEWFTRERLECLYDTCQKEIEDLRPLINN